MSWDTFGNDSVFFFFFFLCVCVCVCVSVCPFLFTHFMMNKFKAENVAYEWRKRTHHVACSVFFMCALYSCYFSLQHIPNCTGVHNWKSFCNIVKNCIGIFIATGRVLTTLLEYIICFHVYAVCMNRHCAHDLFSNDHLYQAAIPLWIIRGSRRKFCFGIAVFPVGLVHHGSCLLLLLSLYLEL